MSNIPWVSFDERIRHPEHTHSASFFVVPHLILIMLPTNYLTATDTQALLANGKTTIEQILHDHRDRYEERDHEVKAWVCVDHQAAAVATKTNKGPLEGVVIGIKDIISKF